MTDLAAENGQMRGSSYKTQLAIRDVLEGRRRGLSALLPMAGPAVIASIAYMDPGNYATNIQAGAKYGYGLLWVVLLANLIAMLFQALSAKLGIVTGRNLAELCRAHFPKPLVVAMWIVSEIAAMATDLAEFLGGAIGLSLLFHLPLIWGMVVTGDHHLCDPELRAARLSADRADHRRLGRHHQPLLSDRNVHRSGGLGGGGLSYGGSAASEIPPRLRSPSASSARPSCRMRSISIPASPRRACRVATMPSGSKLLSFSNREVVVALALAGAVNMAMVMMAAAAFHQGHSDVAEIETAYHTLAPLLGAGAATVFLISLLASGVSSSAVGTMAGQMIMQGFVGFRIPIFVRRLVTMMPAFVVVGLGVNATNALVVSQVVLSIALPVPMIALLIFTQRPDIMGAFANRRLTRIAAWTGTGVVLSLNAILLAQTFGVRLPLLG